MHQRLSEAASAEQHIGQVETRRQMIPIELETALEGFNRLIAMTLRKQQIGEVEVDGKTRWRGTGGHTNLGDGAVELATRTECERQLATCLGVVRVGCDGLPVALHCLLGPIFNKGASALANQRSGSRLEIGDPIRQRIRIERGTSARTTLFLRGAFVVPELAQRRGQRVAQGARVGLFL